ncbi:MAG: hypothetical protein P1U77_18200 [Rubripirellula sp.]|nr:hypothetical protein [Rubripirellula sp.]
MTLIQAGDDKVLCGFDADEISVFVLRKQTATEYALHQIPISEASQELRAFLSSDQSEHGELVAAILQTVKRPTRKRRRKAK